ncbi:hypothetical protein MNBD_GAMMA01-2031 [hydrothermal vent metagenome]|uniref:Uncharacterized protein n=1 Tax=hydrothermal vent metagenome TaxID=652676 RepID=A0A3B0USI3_9ZZZZ
MRASVRLQLLFGDSIMQVQFIVLFLLIPLLSYGETVTYYLQTNPENPQIVNVSADTSALGLFSLEQPRTLPFTGTVHLPEVQCVTASGHHKVDYGTSIKCQKIIWFIHFDKLGMQGVNDVSKQRNLFSAAGWWVLFEWGDIPRLKDHTDIQVCVNQASASLQSTCRAVPNLNQPPLVMAWGKVSAQKTEANIQFNIYIDQHKGLMNEESWSQLMEQYSYLQQLLATRQSPQKNIDIIWVGIDASLKTIGGATGNQAFISNYVVTNGKISQEHSSMLHWVSGHEIFHMLSISNYPLWISESLAQYYGYKSLGIIGIVVKSPIEDWQSGMNKTPHAGIGLYKANAMVVQNKDMSYYSLFYSKGAAFWQELDNALKQKETTLDAFISLLSAQNVTNAELSTKFVTAIENVLEEKQFSQLISKYL